MRTINPPRIWIATSVSPSQTQAITAAAMGSKVADCRRREMLEGADGEDEWRNRAGDDRPQPEHGRRHTDSDPGKLDRHPEEIEGKAPPGLDDGPEEGGETESDADERQWVAGRHQPLPLEVVQRQRGGCCKSRDHSPGIEGGPPPDLGDEHEADHDESEGAPDPWRDLLTPHEPRP
jgi:hypothetical protein